VAETGSSVAGLGHVLDAVPDSNGAHHNISGDGAGLLSMDGWT
jgi:hypothetical protein